MKKNYESAQASFLELTMNEGFLSGSIWVDDNRVTVDQTTSVTAINAAGEETDNFDLILF